MSELMKGVDAKTRMVGENRMELLFFRLGDEQRFGINVFKVREVVVCPPLTRSPGAHPNVRGIATIRGQTLPIIDLAAGIGMHNDKDAKDCNVIVSESSLGTYGFLVSDVERIMNLDWETIKAPPGGLGRSNYLTAIADVDNQIVEILDIEKLIIEFIGGLGEPSDGLLPEELRGQDRNKRVLIVDDSSMARNMICKCIESLGLDYVTANTGKEAHTILEGWVNDPEKDLLQCCNLVITDVEMPDMDGYTLTKLIKTHEHLRVLPVLLHSSLNGAFNKKILDDIGANDFLEKFDPTELSRHVVRLLQDFDTDKDASRDAA